MKLLHQTRDEQLAGWSGVVVILLAVLCVCSTVLGLIQSFNEVAQSSTAPKPEALAQGIRVATIPLIAVVPLFVLGLALLIAGFVFRRPGN